MTGREFICIHGLGLMLEAWQFLPAHLMPLRDRCQHGGTRFVFPELLFQTERVITRQGGTTPFHLPGFEGFGSSIIPLIVAAEFRLRVLGDADESAVHTIF